MPVIDLGNRTVVKRGTAQRFPPPGRPAGRCLTHTHLGLATSPPTGWQRRRIVYQPPAGLQHRRANFLSALEVRRWQRLRITPLRR